MNTKAVEDLEGGDLVDLEGDEYVKCDDPQCSLHLRYEFEFARVWAVDQETEACVVVYFEDDAYGFPTGHQLTLASEADDGGS